MDAASGNPESRLIDELEQAGEHFSFFQAVRLLELTALKSEGASSRGRLGGNLARKPECVRFRSLNSLSFPASEVVEVTRPEQDPSDVRELTVSFMGLTGPAGVLPQHYTSLVIERCHARHKDYALREFLDLFNHRLISFYYRAWQKYSPAAGYRRGIGSRAPAEHLLSEVLFSIVGLGTSTSRTQLAFDEHLAIYYGGHLARLARPAVSLEQLLSDYFELPARVDQFQGRWLQLPQTAQTALPSRGNPRGQNLQLGENTVAGSKVWEIQSKVRVVLGPLRYGRFIDLFPGTRGHLTLSRLIQFWCGETIDFDIQLELHPDDIPTCQLKETDTYQPRLGWNCWLGQRKQANPAKDTILRPNVA